MLPRTIKGLFLAIAIALGGIALLPTDVAQAEPQSPPFEIVFPQDPDRTTFTNDWGSRRSGGRRHRGTDLMAASKMVEVYAIADGVVVKVNERSRPGRYVSIAHADGWESLYIHLNDDSIGTDDGEADWSLTLAPGVEEGAEVKAGQLIGWSGDSGNAEGNKPHTHFELSLDGSEVNPFHILESAFVHDQQVLLWKRMLVEGADLHFHIF